ncbi:hypothetical protein EV175_002689, partial [Coemansia sp. RSA 1933]
MTNGQPDIRSPTADTKAENSAPTLANSATATPGKKSNSLVQSYGSNAGDPTPSRNNAQYEDFISARINAKALVRYGQLGRAL